MPRDTKPLRPHGLGTPRVSIALLFQAFARNSHAAPSPRQQCHAIPSPCGTKARFALAEPSFDMSRRCSVSQHFAPPLRDSARRCLAVPLPGSGPLCRRQAARCSAILAQRRAAAAQGWATLSRRRVRAVRRFDPLCHSGAGLRYAVPLLDGAGPCLAILRHRSTWQNFATAQHSLDTPRYCFTFALRGGG